MRQFPLPRTSPSKRAALLLSALLLALPACAGAKKELGLTRTAPDEFAVVERAPLEMPPDFALRPPRPGASRPQEAQSPDEARTVVFGAPQPTAQNAPVAAEQLLLQQAGAAKAAPGIRQTVDREAAMAAPAAASKKPVAERLLGWTGAVGDTNGEPPASVVDPKAEAERLRQNQAQGKPVTAGETPAVKE
jgi:hypothetical protein